MSRYRLLTRFEEYSFSRVEKVRMSGSDYTLTQTSAKGRGFKMNDRYFCRVG